MKEKVHQLSTKTSSLAGSTWAFMLALLVVAAWLISGPYFNFSSSWQIAIASVTSVIVFVMVFSIQNTQNRDSKATHLKLNELIASTNKARDSFIGLENLTDEELTQIDEQFQLLANKVEAHPLLHKIHHEIKSEKQHRPAFTEGAEHIVGKIFNPVNTSKENEE